MKVLQRIGMGLAGAAIVAMVLALAVPKTVHAMVAALIRDVDNPARATKVSVGCPALGDDVGEVVCIPNYTVPAGQVLVVEQVETSCVLRNIYSQIPPELDIVEGGQAYNHYLAWTSESVVGSELFYRGNQSVRYYAGPGATFQFIALTSAPAGNDSCNFRLNGYLLSYP